jgi:hypothetical protein
MGGKHGDYSQTQRQLASPSTAAGLRLLAKHSGDIRTRKNGRRTWKSGQLTNTLYPITCPEPVNATVSDMIAKYQREVLP